MMIIAKIKDCMLKANMGWILEINHVGSKYLYGMLSKIGLPKEVPIFVY
jgi:hypothetical protein